MTKASVVKSTDSSAKAELKGVFKAKSAQKSLISGTKPVSQASLLPADVRAARDASVARGLQEAKKVPPESLGHWKVQTARTGPLALLKDQEASRLAPLVPLRHKRMAASAFAYYRGCALPMAADLAALTTPQLLVQACGDAHLANFGSYASPERRLVFDINDFDETSGAPFCWDIMRLVASIDVCGRDRRFPASWCADTVRLCVKTYRESMAQFSRMDSMEMSYDGIDVAELVHALTADKPSKTEQQALDSLAKRIQKAQAKNSYRAFMKLMEQAPDGSWAIRYEPPDLVPVSQFAAPGDVSALKASLRQLWENYQGNLTYVRQVLTSNYEPVASGLKVVGVGSVGTRCWILALVDKLSGTPLMLQAKEAQESVLQHFVKDDRFTQNGERVVAGQRLMQTCTDPLLGWTSAPDEKGVPRDYYIRQLWNWKSSLDLTTATPDEISLKAILCGWTLARAHAVSGDRVALAAYLGESDAFDEAMVSFASRYADQNAADYQVFLEAISHGGLQVG